MNLEKSKLIPVLLFMAASSAVGQGITHFEEIADDLYFVGNATHNTVFLVTGEGIILTDPINTDFSTELKTRLDERFDVPVRYVLYSHHHWDHASGGDVWADTATFIGHENMLAHLAPPSMNTALPDAVVGDDGNRNGSIELSEATGDFKARFTLYDYDGNGALSGGEIERGSLNDVRVPDLTFHDRLSVTLGGKSAELVFTGEHTHTDDMSVVVFPAERVGFMVDFISIVRPPRYIRGDRPIETWIEGIRVVEAQDFTIAAPGHGKVDSREYVTLFREYLEKLQASVTAGISAGKSMEELQESIYMDEYRDWISYEEFRPNNIADMYRLLTR